MRDYDRCPHCQHYNLYKMITCSGAYSYGGEIPCFSCVEYNKPKNNFTPKSDIIKAEGKVDCAICIYSCKSQHPDHNCTSFKPKEPSAPKWGYMPKRHHTSKCDCEECEKKKEPSASNISTNILTNKKPSAEKYFYPEAGGKLPLPVKPQAIEPLDLFKDSYASICNTMFAVIEAKLNEVINARNT